MPKKTLILHLDDNADEARLRELLAGEEGVSLEAAEELPEDELTPERIALLKERIAELDAHPEAGIPWQDVHAEAETLLNQHSDA